MLTKRKSGQAGRTRLQALMGAAAAAPIDRRTFLRRSGLAVGGMAAIGSFQLGTVQKAAAISPPQPGVPIELKKSICTHCAVGCTVTAEVQNGVWTGQEPSWDSPINRGSHCAKGASVRELVHSERRLKYPLKLVGGQWERVSWDDAINEIGDKLMEIRESSGPESVYWMGSAKFSNEGTYLFRKLAALWGTNNQDHQARICHSTTVSGVANTWGYGAMTNSFNDIRNSKTHGHHGRQPGRGASDRDAAPAGRQGAQQGQLHRHRSALHPHGRARDRICAHPVRHRHRGALGHALAHLRERLGGQGIHRPARLRDGRGPQGGGEVPPDEVERITGVPGDQLKRVAEMFATQKPATMIWCMGQTQHTVGTANVRASCILCLATGNVGKPGTGANIFRGHDNVQGATDIGLDVVTLPFYYGLTEGAWKHWSRVWEVEYDYLLSRFDSKEIMETPGIPLTRWFDAVSLPKDQVAQRDNLRAMFVQGHASNSITRIPESVKGLAGLELLVVADPHPTTWASLAVAGRAHGQHLSPAGLHAVRDVGLARRLQPLDPVGRADRQAELRAEGRLPGHLSAVAEARPGRAGCSRTSRSKATGRCPRTCCAR